jgi:cell division protein FtsI/penicillin-binding protein 2
MPVEVGASIDLTIDPTLQALAQKTAACYTGRQDVCAALHIARKEDEGSPIGHRLLEHAMVRMAAVAVIDVGSGRIEALAGALSPCTRQESDGPGRDGNCDRRLPYPVRYRPDALLNQAVYHDAMPGSVVKPIMASAFLTDPAVGARWLAAERTEMARTPWPTRDSLRGQLMRSDSARFLDRMFCADQSFVRCDRPWQVQSAAATIGWNNACDSASEDCGKRDLLLAGAMPSLAATVPYGRLLVQPAGDAVAAPMKLRPAVGLDAAKVKACAAGPDGRRYSKDDWEKCRGRIVVDVVADGWGQGNARSSALGVAGMMAAVAASANGDAVHPPHLVQAVRSTSEERGSQTLATASDAPLAPRATHEAAEVILSGLSYSHRAGTARLACEQVFAAKTCHDIDWLAGKTGTPTFPNDDVTLNELARLCAPHAVRTRKEAATCGALRPYKWYVAALRGDPAQPRWTKVIAVLTERNWLADSGRIHGAGDVGPNPAAEIAMQIAGRSGPSMAASPTASATWRTRCAAGSCRSATLRAWSSPSTCRFPRLPRAWKRAMPCSRRGASSCIASRRATGCPGRRACAT